MHRNPINDKWNKKWNLHLEKNRLAVLFCELKTQETLENSEIISVEMLTNPIFKVQLKVGDEAFYLEKKFVFGDTSKRIRSSEKWLLREENQGIESKFIEEFENKSAMYQVLDAFDWSDIFAETLLYEANNF